MVLQIEGRLPSWNAFYAGQNHHVRTAIKNRWRLLVRSALTGDEVPFEGPVNVTTYCEYKGTPVDSDNVCDKLIIDGLVHAQILQGDSGQWVHWVYSRAVRGKRDLITVTVTPVEE